MNKLAIIGYGKMGRFIDQLAPEYDFAVHARIDLGGDLQQAAGSDVAIEFTAPDAVAGNVEKLASMRVPVVVGTTGWLKDMERVRTAVERHDSAMIWSPNFSIGVIVFTRLVQEAARLFANQPQYGAWAWEIHHHTKQDAPSGTLLKLIDEMNTAGYSRSIGISSNRAGAHPGTHEIGFDSAADTITLRHTARSREGFARGALTAARWIVANHATSDAGRGVLEFSDILFGGTL